MQSAKNITCNFCERHFCFQAFICYVMQTYHLCSTKLWTRNAENFRPKPRSFEYIVISSVPFRPQQHEKRRSQHRFFHWYLYFCVIKRRRFIKRTHKINRPLPVYFRFFCVHPSKIKLEKKVKDRSAKLASNLFDLYDWIWGLSQLVSLRWFHCLN